MKRPPPSALVRSLDPPEASVIKKEKHTVVWRETGQDGEPVVVKFYRRRSAGSAFRARIMRFRAEREYRRLRHLERWGIACTEPLAWSAGWSSEHGFHEVLVMREVPNAVPLREHLLATPHTEVPLDSLFKLIRRMHESGFLNQTMYARNVLVNRDSPPGEGYVIADVPRAWTFPRSIVGTEMALWDVMDLAAELVRLGVPEASVPLDVYGLDERGKDWWAKARARNSRGKLLRAMRDAKARVRWLAAWTGARLGGGIATPGAAR
ncbi:MAG TPA: lipopolysaccharide kinase InaA family protein [Vicinamibacteria bacterium]